MSNYGQLCSIQATQVNSISVAASYTNTVSSLPTTPSTSKQLANSNVPTLDDDTIKKFKQLKMSSNNASSVQLMFKKKNGKSSATGSQTSLSNSMGNSSSTSPSISNSNSSSSISSANTKVKKNTRSRSHSRGKYAHYLTSAATAIKTAIKTSPSTSKSILNSISTQTSFSLTASQPITIPTSEELANSNCYLYQNNIITSTSYKNSQSIMNFIDGRPIKTSLPSRSDFFIWYSSVRGFVSHRDVDGSPFIKCLVTVFSKCAYELELIEMVRKVNMLMQQYEKRHFDERNAVAAYFMVPVAEYHLAKKFYFNP